MAGLLGATYHWELPNTHIGFNLPAEKLFHVNGTPREDVVPSVEVDLLSDTQKGPDPILEAGLKVLQSRR